MGRKVGWGDKDIGAGFKQSKTPRTTASKRREKAASPARTKRLNQHKTSQAPPEKVLFCSECLGVQLDGVCEQGHEAEGLTKEEVIKRDRQAPPCFECPVCRSTERCECDEEDRAFVLRTRFESDVKKVARCSRCQAPLTVLHLPRPGSEPPFRLNDFDASWACVVCAGPTVASIALSVGSS